MTDPERPVFLDGHALPGCAAGQWLDLTALGRLCDADHTLRPARIHQAHEVPAGQPDPFLNLDGIARMIERHGAVQLDRFGRRIADAYPATERTLDPPNAEAHAIWPDPPETPR